jgi:hypothetical protein
MPRISEFTFVIDPAVIAAVNRRIARESRLRVATLKRASDPRPLPERIADAMLELSGSGQTVDRDALGNRGFTRAEMSDEMLRRARDIANARAVRQVA